MARRVDLLAASEARRALALLHVAAAFEAYYIIGGRDAVLHEDRFWRRRIAKLSIREVRRNGEAWLAQKPHRRCYP